MNAETKIVGITAGSFDVLHFGHLMMFEECKKHCNYLIVCLQTDPTLDRPSTKNKPIQSITERFMQLRSCKYIDEIVVYETEEDLFNIFNTIHFDKRFLGEDWKGKAFTGYDITGMADKIIWNSRKHQYSSSSLRDRVYTAERLKHISIDNTDTDSLHSQR